MTTAELNQEIAIFLSLPKREYSFMSHNTTQFYISWGMGWYNVESLEFNTNWHWLMKAYLKLATSRYMGLLVIKNLILAGNVKSAFEEIAILCKLLNTNNYDL